jgi:two-component system cell cycle response regulator CpdR
MHNIVREKMYDVIAVDDEATVRNFLSILFELEGVNGIICKTGKDVLDVLKDEGAKVLLTDILMPGMNGVELARAAKEISPSLAIVGITGNASSVDIDSSAFIKILKKPCSAEVIISEIETAKTKTNICA